MITVGPTLFDNFYADPNDYLPADTLVTFTVSMTNAASYPGFTPPITFDTEMSVAINGDWIPWWDWTAAAPAAFYLTNGAGWLYSQTILIPKGTHQPLVYKYGIDDGVDNRDNEAGFATNHVRYIRCVGAYTVPLDTFGTPGTEPLVGNLKVGSPAAGHVPVSWLGTPGVHLQTATNLTPPVAWHDCPETAAYGSPAGIYSTNYPATAKATFFRLIKP